MIFPHTRTRRLSVRLSELTLGEGMELAKLPAERVELTNTELLRIVARGAEKPQPRYVTDPRLMTVEERTLLITTYLAHVSEDGPDFAVGGAHLTDYVQFDRDSKADFIELGEVAGKARIMRPLLGVHAQTLEILCKSRGDWIIGAIACQISIKDVPEPDWAAMSDVAMLEWVDAQVKHVKGLPESMAGEVYAAYWAGADAMAHFFALDFDDNGLTYRACDMEAGHGPARFRASACISGVSKELAGRPDKPSR